MKTAQDYPITTPYGQVPGYPLNNGFHKGEDRAMPVGTQVLVNGMLIGLSGNTGYSTGAHLHIGKWGANGVNAPKGGGFTLPNAEVTEIDTTGKTENGKFVRIQSGAYSWVYLHLSEVKVKVGEKVKGGVVSKDAATQTEVDRVYLAALGRHVDPSGLKVSLGQPINTILDRVRRSNEWKQRDLAAKDNSEFNAIGKALVALMAKFGYKKG